MKKSRKRVKKIDIGYNINSIFPTQLRELLKNSTQENLSEYIGVSRQTISQWKDGNTIPDIYYLKKISEFFNVSYEFLLDGVSAQTKENVDIAKELKLTDHVIHVIKNIYQPHEIFMDFFNYIVGSEEFLYFIDLMRLYLERVKIIGEEDLIYRSNNALKEKYNFTSDEYFNPFAFYTSGADIYELRLQKCFFAMMDNAVKNITFSDEYKQEVLEIYKKTNQEKAKQREAD